MPMPIVHINGFPGVGKLTIARKVVAMFGPHVARLVDSHMLMDPAAAILPGGSADYQPLRRTIRAAVLDTLATSRDTFDSVFVFTDFQPDDDAGRAVMSEYRAMASRRGCTFVPVTLTCSRGESLRRLVSTERFENDEVTVEELVAVLRGNLVTHQPPGEPAQLELDVTELDADAAAQRIFQHVLEVGVELWTHPVGTH